MEISIYEQYICLLHIFEDPNSFNTASVAAIPVNPQLKSMEHDVTPMSLTADVLRHPTCFFFNENKYCPGGYDKFPVAICFSFRYILGFGGGGASAASKGARFLNLSSKTDGRAEYTPFQSAC